MITSLKNNRNLLSKRKSLKDSMGSFEKRGPVIFKTKNASPVVLKRLRTRLKEENRRVNIKQIVALSLFLILLVSVFYYYL
ncbi:hypothetical protein [Formosa sp. A9]|uniref:hypothetical protein n=1 Tax=Formosa sp. A9 TaxID=3442641 RepID=UPI003EB777C4